MKYSIRYIVHNKHIVYNIYQGKRLRNSTEEGEGMLAKVIATTVLLIAVIYVIKKKRDQERRRLQEEELAFFLSLGAGGYSWQNIGKRQAAASSASVPVIHTQIDDSAQAPDRANLAPGETWSRRYRLR